MIKKIWLDTIPILLVIAMFAFVLSVYYGLFQIPFIYQITTATGQTMWRFDTAAWFRNLNGAFGSIEELELKQNPLEWQSTDAGMLEGEFWTVLLNNIAYMFNFLIYALNIFLFVVRLIAYLATNILCIIGFVRQPMTWQNPYTLQTTTFEPNWLMNISLWISHNLQIPFIIP